VCATGSALPMAGPRCRCRKRCDDTESGGSPTELLQPGIFGGRPIARRNPGKRQEAKVEVKVERRPGFLYLNLSLNLNLLVLAEIFSILLGVDA
jgi:hypothetical protein